MKDAGFGLKANTMNESRNNAKKHSNQREMVDAAVMRYPCLRHK